MALYDLLKPHVTKLVVCGPRKNASMREGNQNDGSTHAAWPSCCASTISAPSITGDTAYGA